MKKVKNVKKVSKTKKEKTLRSYYSLDFTNVGDPSEKEEIVKGIEISKHDNSIGLDTSFLEENMNYFKTRKLALLAKQNIVTAFVKHI